MLTAMMNIIIVDTIVVVEMMRFVHIHWDVGVRNKKLQLQTLPNMKSLGSLFLGR